MLPFIFSILIVILLCVYLVYQLLKKESEAPGKDKQD